MVAGFGVAAVYAAGWLRGRRDRYHRLGFVLPFTVAAVVTPVQIGVGDWAARFLAERQPVKLAAIEGLHETQRGAPLTIGGAVRRRSRPPRPARCRTGLSLLAHHDPDAADPRPRRGPARRTATGGGRPQRLPGDGGDRHGPARPRRLVRLAWWRRRDPPASRWFYRAAVGAGFAAPVALEAGWIVTEVGRQPWIVWRVMRVSEAVTTAPHIRIGLYFLARRLRPVDLGHGLRAAAPRHPVAPAGDARRDERRSAAGPHVARASPPTPCFGGADFGAGFWDLVAGGPQPGFRPAEAHRARHRTGLGGQPRVADLRAGDAVDGFPGGLRRHRLQPLRPAHARGRRRDPARRRVRLPQGGDRAWPSNGSSARRSPPRP